MAERELVDLARYHQSQEQAEEHWLLFLCFQAAHSSKGMLDALYVLVWNLKSELCCHSHSEGLVNPFSRALTAPSVMFRARIWRYWVYLLTQPLLPLRPWNSCSLFLSFISLLRGPENSAWGRGGTSHTISVAFTPYMFWYHAALNALYF